MFTLMVVDDSNIIRSKIQRASAESKYRVVATAQDGLDALEKFKSNRPQLVTMDLTMPNMEGIECIDNLIDIDPDVRILVVSALSDQATGIEALERGAAGFLLKPFGEEELRQALDELTEDMHV